MSKKGSSVVAPDSWTCVDLHCGGEPARIVLSGLPEIIGQDMAEKREFFMENLDHIRELLLTEPRGYPCQNVNFIVPTSNPEADFGYIIAEQNKIYPLFSGHNTICTVTCILETGMFKMTEPETNLVLEAPGGLIKIRAECKDGRVLKVKMRSMLSFVEKFGVTVNVPEIGQVIVDIVFSGMWYVVVDIKQLGIEIKPENGRKLASVGEMIKIAAREQFPVNHPTLDYPGPDILVFTTEPKKENDAFVSHNTVVMSNGELDWSNPDTFSAMLDRSPCGSGTAAVITRLHHKGVMKKGDTLRHYGILGTFMEGNILDIKQLENGKTVVQPEISGRAWMTAKLEILLEKDDPLQTGYTVSDIW